MSLIKLPLPILYYPEAKTTARRHQLRAGPLDLIFLKPSYAASDLEIVKSCVACLAVRDQNWVTIPPQAPVEQKVMPVHSASLLAHEARRHQFSLEGSLDGSVQGNRYLRWKVKRAQTFLRNQLASTVPSIGECASKAAESPTT